MLSAAKAILGLIFVLSWTLLGQAELKVGQPFPSLDRYSLEGTAPTLTGQVVLVDFWASWCAPCQTAFPAYSRLQKELGPRGFVLLAVSVDKKSAPYDAFIKRHQPAFVTVRDGTQQLVAAINVPTMPTSYLIDRQGKVRSIHRGFHGEATVQELRTEITLLLEEKS